VTTIPRVVVADPLSQVGLDLLRQHVDVVIAENPADLKTVLVDSRAIVVRSRTLVTADLLAQAHDLELVARAGIGVDNVDVDAATQRGVLVINAPLGNVRSTAEHTIALMFAVARKIVSSDQAVRDGTWRTGYQGAQIAGKRLGVIGAGKVGSTVCAMGAALGMDVVAHDPYLPPEVWNSLAISQVSLEELLAASDFVTIHIPLIPDTHHFLGAAQLELMKQGSYLINAARGGLVDEAALARALKSGRLAGAAVDVFEQEPPVASPLLAAPNLVLTPHVAASTKEAQAQVSMDIAAQVVDFFEGRPVAYPVNPVVLSKV
jgi:D-3-phosphoglycerate dehydrogenase / 2-oxoglutarate reductase